MQSQLVSLARSADPADPVDRGVQIIFEIVTLRNKKLSIGTRKRQSTCSIS